MPIIETKDLDYIYGVGTSFEKKAVDNVNISIEKGEFIGLIGHTGSGKSTFVQMLNGLLKPTNGEILFNGEDIWSNKRKVKDIRFKVGMVFQYPEYQLFEESVYKDIEFGPINMGLNKEERNNRVLMAAKFSGVTENILFRSPFEISGGEKRKVAIAGIIAMNPEVLILDEPTAGLDPLGKRTLLKNICEYHKRVKNTVIFISHSMEDIAQIADKVLVLDRGKAKMFDETHNIFKRDKELLEIGLKIPEVTRIMKKLYDKGYKVNYDVFTVEDGVNQILNLLKERQIKDV